MAKQTHPNEGARRLAEYLEEHETISAAQLAERCGMFRAQLCHLLKGRRIPTLPQAVELNKHARIPITSWLE